MRMTLERRFGTVQALGARGWPGPSALAAALGGGLVAVAVFFGDGSSDSRMVWIGFVGIAAVTVAVVVAANGVLAAPALTPLATAAVAFFAAFVVWQGLSVLWSAEPDRSWNYFNRALVYLALLALGLAAARLRGAPRLAAAALAVLLAIVVVCALATKIFPGLSEINVRVARLSAPIGYWNALALLIDMAVPLGLWIAAPRTRPHWLRALGVVFLYAAGVAVLLTFSRGGVGVAILAVALWFAIAGPRLESAGAIGVAFLPMIAVAGWAFTRNGLTKDGAPHAQQVHDGRWFGLLLVLGALVAYGGAYAVSALERRRPASDALRLRLGRLAVAAAVVAVAVGIAGLLASGITPAHVFRRFSEPATASTVGSGTGHFGSVSSSSRWSWWKESWHAWERHVVGGTGAGTFDVTHRRLRKDLTYATEPHNLPLQFLTETGIVGFALFLGIGFAGAAALVETLRRLEGEERLAAGALVIALAAYVVHGLVDFDWDFVAVTAPALVVLGLLLGAGRPALTRLPHRRTPLAVAAGAVAAAMLYSLLAPWLAARKVDDAYAALYRGNTSGAVSAAKSARSLNPASIDPLLVWALAERSRGDDRAAGRLYTKAISVQPDNWRPWYYRSVFLNAIDGPKAALYDAERAGGLDPVGTAGQYAIALQQELAGTTPP